MYDLTDTQQNHTETREFVNDWDVDETSDLYEDLVQEMFELIDDLNDELRNQVIDYLSMDLGYALHLPNENEIIVKTEGDFSYTIVCRFYKESWLVLSSYKDNIIEESFSNIEELKVIISK